MTNHIKRVRPPIPKSAVPGIHWPALPDPNASAMLAVQYQLNQSQWLPENILQERQSIQLRAILAHAFDSVPHYKEHFIAAGLASVQPFSLEIWRDIPFLSRSEIQVAGDNLISNNIPQGHTKLGKTMTSGSTGKPITAYTTDITRFFWQVFTLREHLWQKRNFNAKFAAIRPEGKLEPGKGTSMPGWGPATDVAYKTGPSVILNSRTDIATQAKWLQKEDPAYFLSLPSNIITLARYCDEHKITIPGINEIRTYGEICSTEVRDVCKTVWNAPVKDMYSAQEVGYIALQCPEHEHYHIQSENLLVEVLDDDNVPCKPGQTGRIVITTLHNYAMPLIRYEQGDYAEVGEACPCGRGLPVLKRILGRHRNMLTLPDGNKHYPSFPAECWATIGGIRQIQLIQEDLQNITANLVTDKPLNSAEERNFTEILHDRFRHPFKIKLKYLESIPRSKNGKYEDFISRINT